MTVSNTNAPSALYISTASAVYRLIAAVADWNDARLTRKALSRLTDRELNDIGLVRGDIDSVARR
ncbi:DUF1127 domain-containing protein [Pseudooceanicola sp. HF7]|uniref:DUF1127 domain-containing protein n=1 Tax=Pseudooceanicola sp. HF7 TaxID=2721560 RepID=UPI00143131DB|nr:DUF1127 domain-containing protein [Pseudooceanicola sp. HF7]NIZ08940.1 DUF1127 domain-containing protein [Pseudooceanicola sp. HF7]